MNTEAFNPKQENVEPTGYDNLGEEVEFAGGRVEQDDAKNEKGNKQEPWEMTYKEIGEYMQASNMDDRTKRYWWRFARNIPQLLGYQGPDGFINIHDTFQQKIMGAMDEALREGKLNNAYVDNKGYIWRDNLADEKRHYDGQPDGVGYFPLENVDRSKKPEPENNTYEDNIASLDDRTSRYVRNLGHNVRELLSDDDQYLAREFLDRMNRAIADGKLNNAYLNNDGNLYNGKYAEEYRGYDDNGWVPPEMEELSKKEPGVDQEQDSIETDTYSPNDWVSFEARTRNENDKLKFRENMERIDDNVQNYLRNLPGNIDQIFGVNSKSYEMLNRVQARIIGEVVDGSWNRGDEYGIDNASGWHNLYLSNSGGLYLNELAKKYEKQDAEPDTDDSPKSFEDMWAPTLSRIDNPKDKEKFITNMKKMDLRTQNYLRNLPGNIDQIFGVGKESYALLEEMRDEIVKRTISGDWGEGGFGQEILELTNEGELYAHKMDTHTQDIVLDAPQNSASENSEQLAPEPPENIDGFQDW